jgi:UDP-N-acetylmuramate dehydrogenase
VSGTLLAEHTTLRLGGPARDFSVAATEDQLVELVSAADRTRTPLLLLGEGSNLVVGDDGFDGSVVHVATRGIQVVTGHVDESAPARVSVTVAAGESWDELVHTAVGHRWAGVEALSGIPGSVGATPIQNVGAYGQEVSVTIASVRCWDRVHQRIRSLASAECGFGYRTSRFKQDPARDVVLSVTFEFAIDDLGPPLTYAELARTLGVEVGERAHASRVREAVLGLRRGKGMILDPADHDTWSAGSFFTNPLLDEEKATRLPADAPRWPQPDGTTKTSAAWLIEHSGFAKGYGNDRVAVSAKHTLALTNRGSASTRDLIDLAAQIQSGVQERFGIRLVTEPTLVGCTLPG